jgi:DNA-binding Xre family transcriptional regulator
MNNTERKLLVPSMAGTYDIGDYRVQVRRRRDAPAYLRNGHIRFLADQLGWSRTAFARNVGIDNSYTAPRIWAGDVTKVTLSVAERIRVRLEVPLEEIAFVNEEGISYDPRA